MNITKLKKHFANDEALPPNPDSDLLETIQALPDDDRKILLKSGKEPTSECLAEVTQAAEKELLTTDLIAIALAHGVSFASIYHVYRDAVFRRYMRQR